MFTEQQLELLNLAFQSGFSIVASVGVVSFAVFSLLNIIDRG